MLVITSDFQRYELEKQIKQNKFEGCIIKCANLHKQITFLLVVNEVPFHRVNYGAGVIKLLPNVNICSQCMGKGISR